jgi:hypothetical protein
VGNALNNYCTIPADDDFMTALVSAIEGMRRPLKLVTKTQLQEEYKRRGVTKSGKKPELLTRLQAHEAQQQGGGHDGDEKDEVASIHITLGTPIRNSPFLALPQVRKTRTEVIWRAHSYNKPLFPYDTYGVHG